MDPPWDMGPRGRAGGASVFGEAPSGDRPTADAAYTGGAQGDRVERARRAGEEVMGHLAGGNSRAAWRTLSGWYRAVEGKAAKPCYTRMEE